MGIIEDLIGTEFGLLLLLTAIVWGGFFLFLFYVLMKILKFNNEMRSLEKLAREK